MCDKSAHRTCARISTTEYQKMQKFTFRTKFYFCYLCLDFPFLSLSNEKLHLLLYNDKEQFLNFDISSYQTSCSIYSCKLRKSFKDAPGNYGNSMVHKICTILETSGYREISKRKYWECLCCLKEKFAFSLIMIVIYKEKDLTLI